MQIKDHVPTRGRLEITLYGPGGEVKAHEIIHNLITEVGDAHIADQMSDQGEVQMSHMAVGTGTGQTAASTTLNNEISRVALDSVGLGTGANDNDVTYSATWAAGVGTGALTEAGIFNDNTAGTMLAYSSFAVKNKGALDTITINWTISFGAS